MEGWKNLKSRGVWSSKWRHFGGSNDPVLGCINPSSKTATWSFFRSFSTWNLSSIDLKRTPTHSWLVVVSTNPSEKHMRTVKLDHENPIFRLKNKTIFELPPPGFTMQYCWWKKSCTSWYGKYHIIYRVSSMLGGAGFLPSTVSPKSKWGYFNDVGHIINWTTTFGLARTTRFWKDRCLTKTWFSSIRKIGWRSWLKHVDIWMFWEVLLMEEVLHQLIWQRSHYLYGFIHPRCRISEPSTVVHHLAHACMVYLPTFGWFLWEMYLREIHLSQGPGCYAFFCWKLCPKATNHSHLDLNAQQLQMRLPSTLFSLLQTCDSLDGSEGLGILDNRLCFPFLYICSTMKKSLPSKHNTI